RSEGAQTVPVHASSDSLFRDDAAALTRLEGHAVVREPGRALSADTIVATGGADAAAPSVTTARGHVVVEGEGKRGEGDTAVHRAGEQTITIEGSDRPAQITETATGRIWRGPALTWSQAPDSIPHVSGERGRSTIVGASPRPAR